ncbi:MAG: 3'(2'),5'-bisphosphate nucleotidase CysQ [Rhodobacteraceae bacterium]|nr:3'(2'),5'-bisphosphate nucleotidase CysQ [Paracoccaceae bacterium]
MNKEQIFTTIRVLAIEAGEKIMEIYEAEDFDVKLKSDKSPVTVADEIADAHISTALRTAFPDIPLVTEEQANTHNLDEKTFFIVDPLDGTKEFIHLRGDFTVNIALVIDGNPAMGVVYAPAKGRLFITDSDGTSHEELGGHRVDAVGQMKRISVSDPDENGLIVVASKSHLTDETKAYIDKYNVADRVSAGSSLKFCLVATGEADLYPRVGRTMEWDTAAGQAVLQGAGGKVVRFDDHRPLTYGKPIFENPYFIACSPGVMLQKP